MASICKTKDVCVVASHLHELFVTPHAEGQPFHADVLLDTVPKLIHAYQGSVSALDDHLNSFGVLQTEKQGWRLNNSMSHLRMWRESASVFGGKAQIAWLSAVVFRLSEFIIPKNQFGE